MTAAEIGRRLLTDDVVADSGFIFRLPPWFGTDERKIAEDAGVVKVSRSKGDHGTYPDAIGSPLYWFQWEGFRAQQRYDRRLMAQDDEESIRASERGEDTSCQS